MEAFSERSDKWDRAEQKTILNVSGTVQGTAARMEKSWKKRKQAEHIAVWVPVLLVLPSDPSSPQAATPASSASSELQASVLEMRLRLQASWTKKPLGSLSIMQSGTAGLPSFAWHWLCPLEAHSCCSLIPCPFAFYPSRVPASLKPTQEAAMWLALAHFLPAPASSSPTPHSTALLCLSTAT